MIFRAGKEKASVLRTPEFSNPWKLRVFYFQVDSKKTKFGAEQVVQLGEVFGIEHLTIEKP
jgi:hypothetical protein